MWTKIAGIILRNRIAFIAGVLLGTIFMGFQARKIQMSMKCSLLPKTDSAYLDYTRFRETFGQEGNVMVFAIQDSGFYQLNKTNDWIQMGNDIKALQGVNALMSITHTFNLQKNTDLKKFEVLPIFPSHIETQAELDSLAYVAEHLPFYDGYAYQPRQAYLQYDDHRIRRGNEFSGTGKTSTGCTGNHQTFY